MRQATTPQGHSLAMTLGQRHLSDPESVSSEVLSSRKQVANTPAKGHQGSPPTLWRSPPGSARRDVLVQPRRHLARGVPTPNTPGAPLSAQPQRGSPSSCGVAPPPRVVPTPEDYRTLVQPPVRDLHLQTHAHACDLRCHRRCWMRASRRAWRPCAAALRDCAGVPPAGGDGAGRWEGRGQA